MAINTTSWNSPTVQTPYPTPSTVLSFMQRMNQVFTCVLCQQEKTENQRRTVVHQTNSTCTFGQKRTICQLCVKDLQKCMECNEDLVLAKPRIDTITDPAPTDPAPSQAVETLHFNFEGVTTHSTPETTPQKSDEPPPSKIVCLTLPTSPANGAPAEPKKNCCVLVLCALTVGFIVGATTGYVYYLNNRAN